MSGEIYRKHGRTVRLERIGGDRILVAVLESGEAETRDDLFSCRTLPAHLPLPEIDESVVMEAESAIVALMKVPLSLERLIITSGVAVHEWQSGMGERVWNDASLRIHASVINRAAGLRMTWDEADPGQGSLAELDRATSALASTDRRPDSTPLRVQLTRAVSAALWPTLLTAMASRSSLHDPAGDATQERPVLTLRQSPWGGYRFDGNGEAVVAATLLDGARAADRWPNVFRPTYRRPSQRMPMNVAASLDRSGETATDAVAVAVLEPAAFDGRDLGVGLLVVDLDQRASPLRLRMTPLEWCGAVVGLRGQERWYPHGAGSFGCEATIDLTRAAGVLSWSGS